MILAARNWWVNTAMRDTGKLAQDAVPSLAARSCDAGALGGTRTPNLLTRRYPRGHPDPFRSVRDLGCVRARCSCQSGEPEGRSSRWLPAWLPQGHVPPGPVSVVGRWAWYPWPLRNPEGA